MLLTLLASTALFLPFEEFQKEFTLGSVTTEQLHPKTSSLSQTLHESIPAGLHLLLDVDEGVEGGLESFFPLIETQAPLLAERGGRVILVGSGSSGRVAIDLAAKCGCQGVIAGGDSALIRAREGFEDSEKDGREAMRGWDLTERDTVILISASGSAPFNVGAGHEAADRGAHVLYFYNSTSIPKRTEQLLLRATPLCVDIGPQAIGGSTRLQAATLAEVSLGALLTTANYLREGKEDEAHAYPRRLLRKIHEGHALLREHVDEIARFVVEERAVFVSPRSNFRRLRDETEEGYVTFLAGRESLREVLIDATESSPTFSTHPIRRTSDTHKKRAEFRAYLIGEDENCAAWQALLGRAVHAGDEEATDAFSLTLRGFEERPHDEGNFTIGVAKGELNEELREQLQRVKGRTGLILLTRGEAHECVGDVQLVLEHVPHEEMGIAETVLLKEALNLISNGSMVLMNKVHGNRMVDMRAANRKLIDRCIRLIQDIGGDGLSRRELYGLIEKVSRYKAQREEEGIYTPSIVKIALTMLSQKKEVQEAVDFLRENEERLL